MTNRKLLSPILFALGVAAGAALMYLRANDTGEQAGNESPASSTDTKISQHPMANAFVITDASDSERLAALEEQLRRLNARIEELEQTLLGQDQPPVPTNVNASTTDGQTSVDTPVSSLSPAVTTENLVKAGIEADLAADIVRRRNEIDLKLLELRDSARREGYVGTDRYANEVSRLREQSLSLRDEIGDDYYDSYLFATGQSNRVRVASVMMGSPAEMAGMKDGDLILNYDNRRMFSWSELQEATAMGERGEYVNVTVLRNGQLQNLWMPRGPLGVRLSATRVEP